MQRRGFVRGFVLGGLAATWPVASARAAGAAPDFAGLERSAGGRLGVCVLDAAGATLAGHRAEERFAMCSTFKVLAAALVLARVDRGEERLGRRVPILKDRVVSYSPETEKHAGADMALGDVCKAALTLSDNTAGNLMLDSFGGPSALTAFARALGDGATRLDRIETGLNEAAPGDPRDTTTPAAMAGSLRRILLGEALLPASRARMTGWMLANTTGDARLRAGLPAGWRVADKTGSGGHGQTNDIALIWPPGGAPIVVAVYFAGSPAPMDARNAVVAEVARRVAAM